MEKTVGKEIQETPKERFNRLASLRVNNILQKLNVLGNCSNKSYYHYSDEEIEKYLK